MNSHDFEVASRASDVMGGGMTDRIIDFVDLSRKLGIIAHGIKIAEHSQVSDQGVAPKTPEGGNVSFWAKGLYIFHAGDTGNYKMFGFDTPFFHYSFTRGGSVRRALAVTTLSALSFEGIDYALDSSSVDCQLTVGSQVTAENLTLLTDNSTDAVESNRLLFQQLESLY